MTSNKATQAIADPRRGLGDTASTEALVERLLESTIGALELLSVYLGWRLGLYEILARSGPIGVEELATAAGIDGRYAQEWLEQQAVAGILEVRDRADASGERRFTLSPAHAEVLAVADSPNHVAPFGAMIVGIAGALPEVVDAYRCGGGVPYERYGPDFRDGQGAINRPAFIHELNGWLSAAEEVHSRLSDDPPARIADVGCGQGHSSVAIARAYPKVLVDGIDLDEASIADAKQVATDADVADRVTFSLQDAAALSKAGPYDLVCIFEALRGWLDGTGLCSGRARVAELFVEVEGDAELEDAAGFAKLDEGGRPHHVSVVAQPVARPSKGGRVLSRPARPWRGSARW